MPKKKRNRKNPLLAGILSFFIAGFGQFYVGKFSRGLLFLFLEFFTTWVWISIDFKVVGSFLNLFISLIAALDAYKIAEKINSEDDENKIGNIMPKAKEDVKIY
jgi:TM2 domain-containing membrane protein YozV